MSGISLVGLMLSITLGMLLLAGATPWFARSVQAQRATVLATRRAAELADLHWRLLSVLRRAAVVVPMGEDGPFVAVTPSGATAFRVRHGVVEEQEGVDTWQPLTDRAVLRIDALRITNEALHVVAGADTIDTPVFARNAAGPR